MNLENCSINTAPVRHLSRIREKFGNTKNLDLLLEIYKEVFMPTKVEEELLTQPLPNFVIMNSCPK